MSKIKTKKEIIDEINYFINKNAEDCDEVRISIEIEDGSVSLNTIKKGTFYSVVSE